MGKFKFVYANKLGRDFMSEFIFRDTKNLFLLIIIEPQNCQHLTSKQQNNKKYSRLHKTVVQKKKKN